MDKKLLSEPMDDLEIINYMNDPNCIIKYSELGNVDNIDQLLPSNNTFKIILIETAKNSGHWVCIGRNSDTIYYFNSYGERADRDWRFVPKCIQKILDQDAGKLSELLKSSALPVKQNYTKYQILKDNIATCGRWCILFLTLMKDKNYDLEDFKEFVDDYKKDNKLKTYDDVVVKLIK
jgi:hypothetical protein